MPAPSLPPGPSARSAFVRRTLAHLGCAALAVVVIQGLILSLVSGEQMLRWLRATPLALALPAASLGATWLARRWGESGLSGPWQVVGLGLHALAQGVVLAPLTVLLVEAAVLGAALAAGCVLVEMSRSLGYHRADRPAAAALALSASVAEPVWYVGRLLRCLVTSRD